jgi:hypothetical protein
MPQEPAYADATAENRHAEDTAGGRLLPSFCTFRVWPWTRKYKLLRT